MAVTSLRPSALAIFQACQAKKKLPTRMERAAPGRMVEETSAALIPQRSGQRVKMSSSCSRLSMNRPKKPSQSPLESWKKRGELMRHDESSFHAKGKVEREWSAEFSPPDCCEYCGLKSRAPCLNAKPLP